MVKFFCEKCLLLFDTYLEYEYTLSSNSKEEKVMLIGIIGLIIWIVCLVANIKIAKAKNRRVGVWVVLSVFFSWITLIVNAVLPAKEA